MLDLNWVISKANDLLQCFARSRCSVVATVDSFVEFHFADPCQVRQVFLNLVINARVVMGRTGTVTIETDGVELDKVCAFARCGIARPPGAE